MSYISKKVKTMSEEELYQYRKELNSEIKELESRNRVLNNAISLGEYHVAHLMEQIKVISEHRGIKFGDIIEIIDGFIEYDLENLKNSKKLSKEKYHEYESEYNCMLSLKDEILKLIE